jgi:hypothetical protein
VAEKRGALGKRRTDSVAARVAELSVAVAAPNE